MFSAALLLLLAAGCVKGEQLTQPASATVQPDQRLTITCQLLDTLDQTACRKGLEWIGYHRVGYNPFYKASLKNKFSISSDSSSNTVTLNGVNVQPEDTAVYYCARDTITQTTSGAEQNPSEHQHNITRGGAVTPGMNHNNNVEAEMLKKNTGVKDLRI
ncbi:Immunoglobulin heavy variable 2-70D [Takifugu flavidus]|nr:Immunoglobulin heavy variable 2-70D [Takifugu flavidus]